DVYPVFVDLEISTQADGAQSSPVPVPFPEDPYEAIRQAYLVGKTLKGSGTSGVRSTSSDSNAPLSSDHPLINTTPTLVPILCRTARMAVRVLPEMSPGLSVGIAEVAAMSDLAFRKSKKDEEVEEILDSDSKSEDAEDEGPTVKDEDPTTGDEGLAARDEGPGVGVESRSLDDESRGLDDEGHSVKTDGFGLREEEAAPDAPSAQTPPSPEWSSGSFPIFLAPSIVPSPIPSPMISLTVPSPIASHVATSTATILVDEDQFIERPVLALETWTGHRFAARAAVDERKCYCVGAGEGP
nr:hypothetical protein [Tanacetum cinerariifolium]